MSTPEDSEEVEANLFAMEILMPREEVARMLHKEYKNGVSLVADQPLKVISDHFGVTEFVMTLRLVQLGYFSCLVK